MGRAQRVVQRPSGHRRRERPQATWEGNKRRVISFGTAVREPWPGVPGPVKVLRNRDGVE